MKRKITRAQKNKNIISKKNMKVLFSAAVLFSILSLVTAGAKSAKQAKAEKTAKAEKSAKSSKSAERAVTMWWVLFNKPSECVGAVDAADCGIMIQYIYNWYVCSFA